MNANMINWDDACPQGTTVAKSIQTASVERMWRKISDSQGAYTTLNKMDFKHSRRPYVFL